MTASPLPEPDWRELYDQAACGLLLIDPTGVIVRTNSVFCRLTGFDNDQVVGKPFRRFLTTGAQLFLETRLMPVLGLAGDAIEAALDLHRSDGSVMPTLVNVVRALSPTGSVDYLHVAVFDATTRHSYEHDLLLARRAAESSEFRVRVLQDASDAFAKCRSEEELAEALAAAACTASAAFAAAVMLITPDGLRLAGGVHPVDVAAWPIEREVAASAAQVVINGTTTHSRSEELARAMREARVASATVVPLSLEGRVIGTLTCFFGRDRLFDEADLELQAALGRQAVETVTRIGLQRALEDQARRDPLTGLANRARLQGHLEDLIERRAEAAPISVVFLDLDGFKLVNDQLGHLAGDSVLREVAARLSQMAGPGHLVGRFGGDEFVVVCEQTHPSEVLELAERIRQSIAEEISGIPKSLSVTASIGIAAVAAAVGPITADRLFTAADAAMYRAKEQGKDRVASV